MIYLLLSIVISAFIFVIFKAFEKYEVDNFPAIIVNYITASVLGFLVVGERISITELIGKPWFIPAFFIGIMFISLFTVMAIVSQKQGVSVASVSVKMSVIIPVVAGFLLYNEAATFSKLTGIVLALIAVFLVTFKKGSNYSALLALPLILFFGNGSLDALLKYCQHQLVPEGELALFSATLFGSAAFWGLLSYPIVLKFQKKPFDTIRPKMKNIIAGITLGIPNYGSIYFLLMALSTAPLGSAQLFPINNVSIVILSTALGIWLFKEKITWLNALGIIFGVVSIFVISA